MQGELPVRRSQGTSSKKKKSLPRGPEGGGQRRGVIELGRVSRVGANVDNLDLEKGKQSFAGRESLRWSHGVKVGGKKVSKRHLEGSRKRSLPCPPFGSQAVTVVVGEGKRLVWKKKPNADAA